MMWPFIKDPPGVIAPSLAVSSIILELLSAELNSTSSPHAIMASQKDARVHDAIVRIRNGAYLPEFRRDELLLDLGHEPRTIRLDFDLDRGWTAVRVEVQS